MNYSQNNNMNYNNAPQYGQSNYNYGQQQQNMPNNNILVTTTEHIPGANYRILGEVFGVTTQSRNYFSNIGAGLKNIVGGEVKSYSHMLIDSRMQAVNRMRANAVRIGGNAVVMMRYDSGSINGDMQSVVAYGTAVRFLPNQ